MKFFRILAMIGAVGSLAVGTSVSWAQDKTAVSPASQNQGAIDDRLVAFFDGLLDAVRVSEDCEAKVDALRAYCQSQRDWIASLDYVTENASDETVSALREKAVSLGRMLAQCYDEKSATVIPSLLERCANP